MADFQIQNADADVIKEFLENEINFDTEFDIVVKDIGLECEQKTFSCTICCKQYSTNPVQHPVEA